MYQVINSQSQAVVGTYSTLSRARVARDKKDSAYGAYVHRVVEVAL